MFSILYIEKVREVGVLSHDTNNCTFFFDAFFIHDNAVATFREIQNEKISFQDSSK